jgi:hypothetical protein
MNATENRPVSIGYLVIGLIFIGLSGAWLLDETGVIEPQGFQWVIPTVLLGAGLIGLFASLGKGMARRRPVTQPSPLPQYGEPGEAVPTETIPTETIPTETIPTDNGDPS